MFMDMKLDWIIIMQRLIIIWDVCFRTVMKWQYRYIIKLFLKRIVLKFSDHVVLNSIWFLKPFLVFLFKEKLVSYNCKVDVDESVYTIKIIHLSQHFCRTIFKHQCGFFLQKNFCFRCFFGSLKLERFISMTTVCIFPWKLCVYMYIIDS